MRIRLFTDKKSSKSEHLGKVLGTIKDCAPPRLVPKFFTFSLARGSFRSWPRKLRCLYNERRWIFEKLLLFPRKPFYISVKLISTCKSEKCKFSLGCSFLNKQILISQEVYLTLPSVWCKGRIYSDIFWPYCLEKVNPSRWDVVA